MRLPTLKPLLKTAPNTTLKRGDSWRASREGSSTKRGYTYRWQKAREQFLADHPICQCPDCDEGRKRLLPANVVDHIKPHRGDETLFWDENNWQAMATSCHNEKTARGQ